MKNLIPRDKSSDLPQDSGQTVEEIEKKNVAAAFEAELVEIAQTDPARLQLLVVHATLKSRELLEEIAESLADIRALLEEEEPEDDNEPTAD